MPTYMHIDPQLQAPCSSLASVNLPTLDIPQHPSVILSFEAYSADGAYVVPHPASVGSYVVPHHTSVNVTSFHFP